MSCFRWHVHLERGSRRDRAMAGHAEQSQGVPAGFEFDFGISCGLEVKGVNIVDREQITVLVGVVSLGGRRNYQGPGRRAAWIGARQYRRRPTAPAPQPGGRWKAPATDATVWPISFGLSRHHSFGCDVIDRRSEDQRSRGRRPECGAQCTSRPPHSCPRPGRTRSGRWAALDGRRAWAIRSYHRPEPKGRDGKSPPWSPTTRR